MRVILTKVELLATWKKEDQVYEDMPKIYRRWDRRGNILRIRVRLQTDIMFRAHTRARVYVCVRVKDDIDKVDTTNELLHYCVRDFILSNESMNLRLSSN